RAGPRGLTGAKEFRRFSCFPGNARPRVRPSIHPNQPSRRPSPPWRDVQEIHTPMAEHNEDYSPEGEDQGSVAVAERREMTTQQFADKARALNIRADLWDEDEYSAEEYEAMLEMYDDTLTNIEEGEIVKARVLRVTDKAVILDLGFKSEGAVTRDEFKDPDALQIGDEVEVFLENLEDEDGVVVLSKKKADFLRVWEKIKEAHESGTPVKGTLTRKIKGGVT